MTTERGELAKEHVFDIPLSYYEWLAGIEKDVRVHDLMPQEIAGLASVLRTTLSKDTGRDAVVRLANELRERSRFPSGVARISEAKAREIAESALSADRASPPPGNREAVLEEAAKALEAKAAEAKAKHNPQRNVTALLVGQVYEDAAAVVRALRTRHDTEGAGQ